MGYYKLTLCSAVYDLELAMQIKKSTDCLSCFLSVGWEYIYCYGEFWQLLGVLSFIFLALWNSGSGFPDIC